MADQRAERKVQRRQPAHPNLQPVAQLQPPLKLVVLHLLHQPRKVAVVVQRNKSQNITPTIPIYNFWSLGYFIKKIRSKNITKTKINFWQFFKNFEQILNIFYAFVYLKNCVIPILKTKFALFVVYTLMHSFIFLKQKFVAVFEKIDIVVIFMDIWNKLCLRKFITKN